MATRPDLTLRTPRLSLRPLSAADLAAMHAISTDPVVRRFLWDDRVVPEEECAELLAESRCRFDESGAGLFGVALRQDPAQLIGYAGLWAMGDPPELELLYALLPAHAGRGLATEAARAVMAYGAQRLGLTEFRACVDAPNAASIRVLERLGFVREQPGGGGDLLRFHRMAAGIDGAGTEW